MPDDKIKISALPSALSLNNTDVLSVVQGMDGDNKVTCKAALAVLAAHLLEVMQYNDLDTASKTIIDAINSVLDNLADEYDESSTYSVGDCVQHNGLLYQCNTAITTAEQWDSTHWTQIKAVDVGAGGGGGGLPSDVIAPDYDSSQTYEVGDYVMHEDQLYECNTDISTAEAWDPTHWTLTTVEAEMKKKADESNTYTKAQTDALVNGLIDDAAASNQHTYSSNKIEASIDELYPVESASGSIASFNTALAKPLVSCVVDENATKLYQRGVNLWDEVWELGTIIPADGTDYPSSTKIRSKNYITVKPDIKLRYVGIALSVSTTDYIYFYDINKSYIGYEPISHSGIINAEFTTPNNCYYIRFICNNTTDNNIAINYPSSITTYVSYNNLSTEYNLPLTDLPITFSGDNNFFTDYGDITVQYKDTIQNYIDKQIVSLQALILSL